MTLSEYVKKKNGVTMGHSKSLRNNLQRSLGAKNFAEFWNFWNPIFGYYLGSKIFKPLKKVFPKGLALFFTFIFSGLIHDLVTTLIRGKLSLFFSVWFLLMGTVVAISTFNNYDLSNKKWIFRAFANVSIITMCFCLTKYLNTIFYYY
ncbi:MBOAT family O-acyltransferase [Chryseobacterium sp. 3008163]|uniref:MBOAT family O-acyltransferase n=1 Tax=Chryseobacterium sp. 3008163 TaxID=2478663 RepID=UPI000F0CFCE3|nr:MBOAT family O-acyltransferase [Chryseobacterium sp. 3008163]AYM99654.1 acyltransferase [Chryseobacterium sp. 3008163]